MKKTVGGRRTSRPVVVRPAALTNHFRWQGADLPAASKPASRLLTMLSSHGGWPVICSRCLTAKVLKKPTCVCDSLAALSVLSRLYRGDILKNFQSSSFASSSIEWHLIPPSDKVPALVNCNFDGSTVKVDDEAFRRVFFFFNLEIDTQQVFAAACWQTLFLPTATHSHSA